MVTSMGPQFNPSVVRYTCMSRSATSQLVTQSSRYMVNSSPISSSQTTRHKWADNNSIRPIYRKRDENEWPEINVNK